MNPLLSSLPTSLRVQNQHNYNYWGKKRDLEQASSENAVCSWKESNKNTSKGHLATWKSRAFLFFFIFSKVDC